MSLNNNDRTIYSLSLWGCSVRVHVSTYSPVMCNFYIIQIMALRGNAAERMLK